MTVGFDPSADGPTTGPAITDSLGTRFGLQRGHHGNPLPPVREGRHPRDDLFFGMASPIPGKSGSSGRVRGEGRIFRPAPISSGEAPMTYSLIPAPADPTDFDWVLRHVGKSCSVLHRWRNLLRTVSPGGWGTVREYSDRVMILVADPRVLFTAAKVLASGGPKAPGPNGLRLESLADDELWQMCSVLSRVIRRGKYRLGPQRTVWVAKTSGIGKRPIVVSDVQDRVVEKAAALVLRPMLDVLFEPLSFAYRPWRTREQAIAVAEVLATGGYPVWLTHDLRDAYRRVPLTRLSEVVFKLLPCPTFASS